ncbi:MAG: DUF86 domain-containing protein [Armatimonadota bacterium]
MIRDDMVYLQHILEAALAIEEYLQGIDYDHFMSNRMVQDAVIRRIEVIGEATRNLSLDIKQRYSDVPWQRIAGMRNKLIYGYFGVDMDAVWGTATRDVASLKVRIEQIVQQEKSSDQGER